MKFSIGASARCAECVALLRSLWKIAVVGELEDALDLGGNALIRRMIPGTMGVATVQARPV